jgi:hypothetical protein
LGRVEKEESTARWSRSRMLRENRTGGSARSFPGYLSKREN